MTLVSCEAGKSISLVIFSSIAELYADINVRVCLNEASKK